MTFPSVLSACIRTNRSNSRGCSQKMMTKSTRKRSLSLGSLCLRAGGFAVVLPVLWSGIAAPWVHAQTPPWDGGGSGGVQVSLTQLTSAPALPTTATTLNLDILSRREPRAYYLRLTAQSDHTRERAQ